MIGIHRPPSTKNVFYDQMNTLLKERDTKNEIILLWDFNRAQMCNTQVWFEQVIEGPTRRTSSSETLIWLLLIDQKESNLTVWLQDCLTKKMLIGPLMKECLETAIITPAHTRITISTELRNITSQLFPQIYKTVVTGQSSMLSCIEEVMSLFYYLSMFVCSNH